MRKTQIATSVSQETLQKIDEAAAREAISRSAFIRRAVRRAVQEAAV